MIKYIGSKRTLVPTIGAIVDALGPISTACDLFSGTTRVAQLLKRTGAFVVANDSATYAATLARAYVEADARAVDVPRIRRLLDELAELPGVDGYFTETFCTKSRYLQPHNGRRIDAIRPAIDELAADPVEHAVLLTSLIEAADRVDSTTGLQMAYLKQWAPRSRNELELRVPQLLDGPGEARQQDANELVRTLGPVELCYIDPPYNQHSYYSNYHVWETLARGDAPAVYGIACKRVDCRTTKSPYNSRVRARDAFVDLVQNVDARHLLVSFSDEGFLDSADIEQVLAERGEVAVLPVGSRRYVGAQIGIHDLQGRRVGEVSHLHNTEFLFLAGPDAARAVEQVARQLAVDGGAAAPARALRPSR